MAAGWVYTIAWTALALVYATSFVVSGAPPLLALRGTGATIVPNALLGNSYPGVHPSLLPE